MLLLCTNKHGGRPPYSTSKLLTYPRLSPSLRNVPSLGAGSVVRITAVSSLFCAISSLRIRCCARDGRVLKESGMAACAGKPGPEQ